MTSPPLLFSFAFDRVDELEEEALEQAVVEGIDSAIVRNNVESLCAELAAHRNIKAPIPREGLLPSQ